MVGHRWVDEIATTGKVAKAGVMDADLGAMDRFVVYRVRFQVSNTSDEAVELTPVLEAGYGAQPTGWFTVPAVDPLYGNPFYVASDDGKVFVARSAAIAAAKLRDAKGPPATRSQTQDLAPGDASAEPAGSPHTRQHAGSGCQPRTGACIRRPGVSSSGLNPAPPITLPANSFTEVEFAVRATVSAAWSGVYAFRLQPVAETIDPGQPLVVTMRERPTIQLTLPRSATNDARTSFGGNRYSLATPVATTGPQYRLVADVRLAATVDPTSPHIESSLADDGCAACHSAHRAAQQPLIMNTYRADPLRSATEPYDGADFALCIQCHQESPFADTSGSANPLTDFPGHGYHLGMIENDGTGGLEIDTPGDGQGNALCAECHYNLHGTPSSERGLVIFAPDVEPFNGVLTYDAPTQSCTLTCHGRDHDGLTFAVPSSGS